MLLGIYFNRKRLRRLLKQLFPALQQAIGGAFDREFNLGIQLGHSMSGLNGAFEKSFGAKDRSFDSGSSKRRCSLLPFQ
nr:hypothetical protein Q903MT_gene1258 [Picea sitchensis]